MTLLGRNGMGKTTTIRCIMGLLQADGGGIVFDGASIIGAPPERIARRGVGLVPQGRQVFPTLTVHENLVATAANRLARKNPVDRRARLRIVSEARRTAQPMRA